MKVIDILERMYQEEPGKFEAFKFVQARIDLYFRENFTSVQRADSEHNQTGRALSGLLITYSTVVIGLASIVFSQDKLLSSLNACQKGLLFAGLVLLFLSILGGALELWDAMTHFKKTAALYAEANSKAPILEMESIKDLHNFKKNLFETHSASSSSRGLIVQVLLLIVATLLYLILAATIIFR